MANVAELLAIPEQLTPDVIFAEIPATHVDRYLDGSHGTLESIAVARYRQGHQADVVPVDLAKPDEVFFQSSQDMFDMIERTSPAYRRMVDQHSHDTRTGGFPYLNSDRCIDAWAAIRSEALDTLEYINRPRLREVLDRWNRQIALRDQAMARTIAEYAVRSGFVHAVFLFGAAHMHSIIECVGTASQISTHQTSWEVDIPLGRAE